MPLAGTGCAISPAMLAKIAQARNGDPFDASSLTEDYELSRAQDKPHYSVKSVMPIENKIGLKSGRYQQL
jgi:adsorption protein B